MTAATRALWVTAEPPDFDGGGGNIRQAHLVRALARRVELHLLVAGRVGDPAVRESVASVTEVGAPPPGRDRHPMVRRVNDLGVALFARQPFEIRDSTAARRLLAAGLAAAGPFDLVLVEHSGLAGLVPPRPRRDPWVLSMQNLLSRRASHEVAIARGRRQRWMWRRERERAVRFEEAALAQYDRVVVCSDEDNEVLHGRGLVVPNGVDVERYRPTPLPPSPRIVLTATLGYPPNVDGVLWFCADVLPRVREAVPEASVSIVGRQPAPSIRALRGSHGVDLHFDVPSTVPFLQEARVAVVPVRVGTGTRIKALEAMAAGRPVVGTTIGLEGLGAVDGVNAVVADDAAGMADAIVRALRDESHAERLAAAGRAHVEQRFDWVPIGDAFADAMAALAGREVT